MHSLEQVRKTFSEMLKSPILFSLVNTRIILRTGVDLVAIKAEENRDPAAIAKVIQALKAMGYTLTPEGTTPRQQAR